MSGNQEEELEGWAKTRPVRIAFLVEFGEHADLVLDGIFADCYARWGGRFSLIVPCVEGRVVNEYWPWLEVFDPDLIYSYVNLASNAVLELHERLVPADYIFHRLDEQPRLDVHGFKPRYHFTPLSSLSTVFRLARHSSAKGEGPAVKVIDSWHTENPSRFLTDNLGIYATSAGTGMYPNDARKTAGLLTVVSDEHFNARKYGVPRDLDRVASEWSALWSFANREATAVSLLASLYVPRVEVSDHHWSGEFNLVLGESCEDRLLFWNARLLIPAWLDSDLCCFRVTLEQLKDVEFVGLLAQILNTRNHVNHGSGGHSRLRLRTASHSPNELNEALGYLRNAKVWSATEQGVVVPGGTVLPSGESLHHAREQAVFWDGQSRGSLHPFRWSGTVARPPALEPEHLADSPPRQAFTQGLWALDIAFENAESKPRLAQNNLWVLPKRWRMAPAFQAAFAERGFLGSLPPMCRRSRSGDLTLFAGVDRVVESIKIPSIEQAMDRALCWDAAIWNVGSDDPPWPSQRAQWIRPSGESPHLVGVLGMTGGLLNAKRLLLHPFLRDLFASFGGAPNLADADVRATVDALAKRARGEPTFQLQEKPEREALAALIAKAAQSLKAPKTYVSLENLQSRWKAYRERYWSTRPDELGDPEGRAEWDAREQRAIDECLVELRTRRMLFQGYPWMCHSCQHRNWVDFQALRPTLSCDVCRSETDLPVGIPWQFRPNDFLIESLRSHSVLSLVWLLSALRDRARRSFIYLGPTCLGYSNDYDRADAEADLLALVDGEAILCEVKSAWRSLRAVHVKEFVQLAKRLRPDQAVLAVMEEGSRHTAEIEAGRAQLSEEGIRFELLTPATFQVDDDPYLAGNF